MSESIRGTVIGIASALMAVNGPAEAEIYVVTPERTGDFPTIQAAIDAVVAGDIIELDDGTFSGDGNRDLDYGGKAIVIRSRNADPEACIIAREM